MTKERCLEEIKKLVGESDIEKYSKAVYIFAKALQAAQTARIKREDKNDEIKQNNMGSHCK